ncbi:MAG: threonylcarbamoyl-AMP synthase [Actinomycetia bacterium]|nr:threonylcarbamoyl-AMP synthase [Actinomycetes bacterium]
MTVAPLLDAGHPDALARAAAVLRDGGAVVLPTDTVYGVAALPSVPGATEQLFALKQRSDRQPLAVLVADAAQAASLVAPPAPDVARWMAELWPGPLTIVLARSGAALDLELGGDRATIGMRCPALDVLRALADLVGPIATTSANRHGHPTPTTAAEAADALAGDVALVLDGGPCDGMPSTVVDAATRVWRVLREGPVEADRLGPPPA